MKTIITLAGIFIASACVASAQMGRSLDWTTFGGDPQRTGWEKADSKFTKEQVAKEFQFLWKNTPDGMKAGQKILPPVIIGNLIGYRGFKELAFIAGSNDTMHVMDADLNRVYWHVSMGPGGGKGSANCPGGLTAMPTLMAIAMRRPGPRPAPGAAPPARPAPNPMFGPRSIYTLASDGKLHILNVANGAETFPPVSVLPPNAHASTMNMADGVLYTTTGCGGSGNAVYAIDVGTAAPGGGPTVHSFPSAGGGFVGLGGPVIGTDGTVYVQAGDGRPDPANNKFSNALVALTPKELKLKDYFLAPPAPVTPVVFAYQGKDLVVTASKDGRLSVLDSASLGGADHKTPLSQTDPIVGAGGSLFGALASWEQQDGPRWVLATVWGPTADGSKKTGSIVALKLEDRGGKPVLTPMWASRELVKPGPPVIANGVVFALSNGENKTHAVLYALDAANGNELWSSGSAVTAPGNQTGMTIANGRVYFPTTDNTLWVFGIPLEW